MQRTKVWWILGLLVTISLQSATPSSESDAKISTSKNKSKSADLNAEGTAYRNIYASYGGFGHQYKTRHDQTRSKPIYVYNPLNPAGAPSFMNVTVITTTNCGDRFPGTCKKSRYRTFDGSCNNLHKPTWGMAHTRYGRLLAPIYADEISTPTRSVTGGDLPLARLLSYTLFPNVDINDKKWTLAAMQWGQIMTHDMGLGENALHGGEKGTKCCTPDGILVDKGGTPDDECFPLIFPPQDPVYAPAGIQCREFVRTETDQNRGCTSKRRSAEQLTVVTHFLDASHVYGSSQETAAFLRAYVGGRMRVDVRSNREWLPAAANKSRLCDVDHEDQVCYEAGDTRVNQNPQLTIIQVIMLREHNRIAGILAKMNPHWTDETIYQETRRIVIAEHQHISYFEWLPIFIGIRNSRVNKIIYFTKDYVNDYNPKVDPRTLNEHATAAFRYFHSLIAGFLKLITEHRSSEGTLRLSDYFNRPGVIEEGNNMDDLARGLGTQPQKAADRFFDREITDFLFREGKPLGTDLIATDIQRGRDHGIASYNHFREYCGLPRAKQWNDFTDWIAQDMVEKLSELYLSVDDVDLFVGGSLERHVKDTLAGPTFLCILTEQFLRSRAGDRYWYESGDPEVSFTIEQLNEIRKISISRLFCDNGDNVKMMQPRGFEQVSESNVITDCDDLPQIDLSYWKDYAQEIENVKAAKVYKPLYKKK